jgi:DNA-binding FadR family transcriptional regulator
MSMRSPLEPLQSPSLPEVFIARFEELILSGRLAIGERLPSERELAVQLGVSRPVVHQGLVELAARGLVTLKPRVGAVVSDYRRHGSLTLLSSLLTHRGSDLDPALLDSLLAMRRLIEVEAARQAARQRSKADLQALRELLDREASVEVANVSAVADVDFDFHHQIALASGNIVYPMLIKSCEDAYKSLSGRFFAAGPMAQQVFEQHAKLVEAISRRQAARAAQLMEALLKHGRTELLKALERADGARTSGR